MDREEMIKLLHDMLLIRRFEERTAQMYAQGKIAGYCHLAIGQEAVNVGFMSALEPEDYIVGSYRDHGQALVRGADPGRVMAELFGRRDGLCRGKGGSMHMFDASRGFLGGHGIVGGGMPLAVGIALAMQYDVHPHVVLSVFGDGAVNEGAFHESLNLAALWKLPVIFLCENNQFGMGTAVARASAMTDLANRANCYGIDTEQVDGMDVLKVLECAERTIRRVRQTSEPRFVEAITYRFRGHSMADPGKYRSKEEVGEWEKRDPVANFRAKLIQDGFLTEEEVNQMDEQIKARVIAAAKFADTSPELPVAGLYEDVYA